MNARQGLLLLTCLLGTAVRAEPPGALALQVALDRRGFGVGPIDGIEGPRTRVALADFAHAGGLGEREARAALAAGLDAATRHYTVTSNDVAQIGAAPQDWLAAAAVPTMAYESISELLAERFHASPGCLERLNPGWTSLPSTVGLDLQVPNTRPLEPSAAAASIEIDCAAFRLRVRDANGAIVASFPCSMAFDWTRVPTGELRIVSFAPSPDYAFDPANFPESARAQEIGKRLIIPPGPNNPVGVYWLTLSRPGFGIHGTPHPETIGRAESHGCFRLTNWDIEALARLVRAGTEVRAVNVPPPPLAAGRTRP